MSSILTPSRRERAKRKAKQRAAHSMSPSSGASRNNDPRGRNQRYLSMTDDNGDDGYDVNDGHDSPHRGDNKSVNSSTNKGLFVKPSGGLGGGRVVTPTKLQQPHLEQDALLAARQYRQARAAGKLQGARTPTRPSNTSFEHDSVRRSVSLDHGDYKLDKPYSIDEADEDMPMDEMMDLGLVGGARNNNGSYAYETPTKNSGSSNYNNLNTSFGSTTSTSSTVVSSPSHLLHTPGTYRSSSMSPSSSSIGISRMITALQNGATSRPADLSRDEIMLWDVLQTAMVNDRNQHVAKRRNLEMCLQEATAQLGELQSREGQLEIDLRTAQQKVAELEHKIATNSMRESDEDNDDDEEEGNDTGKGSISLAKQVEYLQEELAEKEEQMEKQQEDHEAAIRAIQRVLADITTEKDEMMELFEAEKKKKMQETLTNACDESLPTSRSAPEGLEDITATLKSLQEEKETAQREAEQKAQQVLILEQELNASKKDLSDAEEAKKLAIAEKERLQSQLDDSQAKITTLIAENEVLTREKSELVKDADLARSMAASAKTKAEDAEKTIADLRQSLGAGADSSRGVAPEVDTPLPQPSDDNDDVVSTASSAGKQHQQQDKQQDHTSISIEEFRSLQKTLAETSSSLETSKKIIASMESANGSLAVDMRSKLKAKEEELANVQKESDERKRRLDSLATELRDLQNKYGDVEEADRRIKSQLIKQRALMGHLESSLSDLQSAVVVYESSGSNMDEIAEILGDTLYAVTLTLNATEQFVDDYDDASVAHTEVSLKSDVGRHIDAIIRNDREAAARDLRKELDQKKIAVKRLEEALKKQNEEMKKLRSQSEGRSRPPSGDDTDELKAEIENLRKQVSTNLEVLANKERELHVLRSSLKVDDNDAGYISDDASDDDEDEGDQQSTYSSPARLNGYSPADAEALATILSQTNGSMDGSVRARELESLRKDLSKIKSEKEKFEKDLKEERESLASAKMIISSLENANKQMMEDLRSRLQDSNAAIAALLDKSMEHEKTSEKLKEELDLLNKERETERKRYEAELKKMQIQNGSASQNGDLELINEAKTQDNELPCEEKKEELFVSPLSHDEPAMQLL